MSQEVLGYILFGFILGYFFKWKTSTHSSFSVIRPKMPVDVPISPDEQNLVRQSLMDSYKTPALTEEKLNLVAALIKKNRIIEAIKLVREMTGLGLKESKDMVEVIASKLK